MRQEFCVNKGKTLFFIIIINFRYCIYGTFKYFLNAGINECRNKRDSGIVVIWVTHVSWGDGKPTSLVFTAPSHHPSGRYCLRSPSSGPQGPVFSKDLELYCKLQDISGIWVVHI